MNYSKMTKAELIEKLKRSKSAMYLNNLEGKRESVEASLETTIELWLGAHPFENVCRAFCVEHGIDTNAEAFKDWVNERLDSEHKLKQHVGVQSSTIDELRDEIRRAMIEINRLDSELRSAEDRFFNIEHEKVDYLSAKLNDANEKLDAYKIVLIDIVRE